MCPTPGQPAASSCWGCSNPSKYKCPKCETPSCSLPCVKRHKVEQDCDGLRNKLKFVSLSHFTDMDVVNDFRLLEDVTKTVDKCKRDKLKRSTRQGSEMMVAPRLQKHLQRLQFQARSRKCYLKILPPHFDRRKYNTSCYEFKQKVIRWHVVLKFPHCGQTVSLPAVSERTKLWKIISDYVEFKATDEASDPFQHYRSLSYGGIRQQPHRLYLKAEGGPVQDWRGPRRRFYPLDLQRSLRAGLAGATIVEHPVIHVVYRAEDCQYREEEDYREDGEQEVVRREQLGPTEPSRAEVISQTEAMQADPESYKKYFDFYLKYYSAKYAQQGVTPEQLQATPAASPAAFSCPPPSRPWPSNNTFPGRQAGPSVPHPCQFPTFSPSLPPPNFSTPPPTTSPLQPPGPSPAFSTPPPPCPPNQATVVNQSNMEAAAALKRDLQQSGGGGLASLVGYGMSDSEEEEE